MTAHDSNPQDLAGLLSCRCPECMAERQYPDVPEEPTFTNAMQYGARVAIAMLRAIHDHATGAEPVSTKITQQQTIAAYLAQAHTLMIASEVQQIEAHETVAEALAAIQAGTRTH